MKKNITGVVCIFYMLLLAVSLSALAMWLNTTILTAIGIVTAIYFAIHSASYIPTAIYLISKFLAKICGLKNEDFQSNY